MGALAIFVLVCLLPQIAFGANPAEEAKHDTAIGGGIDPQGDSWLSIQHSLEQFRHPEFILRCPGVCLRLGGRMASPIGAR
jgi:hypothetical protein